MLEKYGEVERITVVLNFSGPKTKKDITRGSYEKGMSCGQLTVDSKFFTSKHRMGTS